MTVLWRFVRLVLMAVSLVLWFAGLTGIQEGVLRIGKKAMPERRSDPNAQRPLVTISSIVSGMGGIRVSLAVILL